MRKLVKPLVFTLALVPLGWLVFIVLTGRTSANPAEDIILTTGIWALRFLLASLAITPLRRLTGWNALIQYRRMLGLFAFFYASVHMLSYLAFDQLFSVGSVLADVANRPFITAGMGAFVSMIPLAVTSTRGWIRRLGRRWQLLHRLGYVSAMAACLHFVWKVKVAIGEPVYYAGILAVLLAFRLLWRLRAVGALRRQTAQA
ncbi:MAG: sulfite oxidase heme-binding subunit YedZ [Burkholderiales bacterium]